MRYKFWIVGVTLLVVTLRVHAEDSPKIDGWKAVGKPAIYNPQNVWDAINGAAEIYIDYGFKELLIQSYKKGDSKIELEVYDQGQGINAFGIFRRERPPSAKGFEIGGEAAIAEPYTCMMFKGTYLARIKGKSGDLTEALCKEILEGVALSLKGEGKPEALAELPSENRVPDSEGYTPHNYLGITDLPKVLHAKYEGCGEDGCELFAIMETEAEKVDAFWRELSTKWKHIAGSGYCILHREIPYRGPVVVVKKEGRIWGVTGKGDLDSLSNWLQENVQLD